MEILMNILTEIDDSIDWAMEERLIDDQVIDSFTVINLIAELEEYFDVQISAADITSANLNSAASMWQMIQRLRVN